MKNAMLKIDNVSKEYKLGQIGGTTIYDELQRFKAKIRKKEDPTRKIGSQNYIKGEKFLALKNVSFEVEKGERVGIIGHNGAGKSTLLKLISRVTAPSEGEILMNGRVSSMLEVGTGFHGDLTGRENIYMNGAILGMTKKEIDAKIEDIIEFSECRQFIDTPVKRYSSGMFVKLAFSVASHLDSEILIMDEVLAVGDMAFQNKCLNKMNEVSKTEGRTILYVSHNMDTIRKLCNRIIVLSKGKKVFDGNVDEGIKTYSRISSETKSIIDYEKIDRLSWLSNTKIRVVKSELIGKKEPIYDSGENMTIKLTWKNETDITNLCLRIEMLQSDRTPIGTFIFNNFYNGKKNELASSVFNIDISKFVSGTYTMNFSFFEQGQNCTSLVDCVYGQYFKIENIHTDNIGWDNVNWGYIYFNKDRNKLKETTN